jgi:group I intron endonuclease
MSYTKNYAVYKITNTVTKSCYIGVDSYFPKRIKQHQNLLAKDKHKNKHLQFSYNKHGKDNFTFELLEKCVSREEMLGKEKIFILHFNSLADGYNHTEGGEGSCGYKHSEEAISKMSAWKRIITQEWRDNISKGTIGKPKKRGIRRVNHPDYTKWLGGEKHPAAKLNQVEVYSIRLKYLEGGKQRDLAKEYLITPVMINFVISNKNWVDVNYRYIKKTTFKDNIEEVQKLKNYLYEKLQTC